MQMTERGLLALAGHEGVVPAPYRDSTGTWTFGIGHTAAAGAPGTRVSFGKWTRRAWMGAGYLVARTLDADGVNSHLVDRFGQE